MTKEGGGNPEPRLTPECEAAVDALIAARSQGLELSGAEGRVGRAAALLSLLGGTGLSERDRGALVDVTVLRAVRRGGAAENAALQPVDADAVDALVEAEFDVSRVPTALRQRAAHAALLGELVRGDVLGSSAGAGEAEALSPRARAERLERLMSSVEGVRPLRLTPEYGVEVPASRWRLREFVSVAAVVAIGTSLAWPAMTELRHRSQREACAAGLVSVASAMGRYAGDFRDSMPMATASLGNARWWDVVRDKPVSNASNLFTLARTGYATLGEMACAGNASACRTPCQPGAYDWSCLEEVSYSYQIMFGPAAGMGWGDPSSRVVLADASPVSRRAARGERFDPMENSWQHQGRGQNVLFSDGSVRWLTTPMRTSTDNIWLPAPRVLELRVGVAPRAGTLDEAVVTITGRELPRSADDGFVGP